MEFAHLKSANRRQMLENELAKLEAQMWGRERDRDHWLLVAEADLTPAAAHDSRIANNRLEECKQELASAEYDLIKLKLKYDQTVAAARELGPAPNS